MSTPRTKFRTFDTKNFCLNAQLKRYEDLYMKLDIFQTHWTILPQRKGRHRWISLCRSTQGCVYGLLHMGLLAPWLLGEILGKHVYCQLATTPVFLKHKRRQISFMLTVNDFRVKYICKEYSDNLEAAVEEEYEVSNNWEGTKYCVLAINWNYEIWEVNISMPQDISEV